MPPTSRDTCLVSLWQKRPQQVWGSKAGSGGLAACRGHGPGPRERRHAAGCWRRLLVHDLEAPRGQFCCLPACWGPRAPLAARLRRDCGRSLWPDVWGGPGPKPLGCLRPACCRGNGHAGGWGRRSGVLWVASSPTDVCLREVAVVCPCVCPWRFWPVLISEPLGGEKGLGDVEGALCQGSVLTSTQGRRLVGTDGLGAQCRYGPVGGGGGEKPQTRRPRGPCWVPRCLLCGLLHPDPPSEPSRLLLLLPLPASPRDAPQGPRRSRRPIASAPGTLLPGQPLP